MIYGICIEQDNNSVIVYYNNSLDRKNMLLALFAIRNQVIVSVWAEDKDGKVSDYHQYTKHAGDKWVTR